MARTYSDLITLVRNWANRDIEVLPNTIIADAVRYAADKAYRTLRIAPLEHTVIYDRDQLAAASSSTNNRFSSVTELAIPSDLIEFIQIRGVDMAGRTTRMFNEKADLRTFNDVYAERYSDLAIWTRQGNCILIAPAVGNSSTGYGATGVGPEETIELHYYRRLPSLHARYEANVANANLGLLSIVDTDNPLPMPVDGTPEEIPTVELYHVFNTELGREVFSVEAPGPGIPRNMYYGMPVPNWLRDENERVVLMGALAECFAYLQEDEQAAKYLQLFNQEIQELNNEDVMRNASGGNVQMNFNGRGLI